jgi:four helix bundle protein
MNYYELENRLVDYSSRLIELSKSLDKSFIAKHLGKQLLRSGSSAALNYGEAQGGESRKDFIHKMKLALKELRESFICLKIIESSGLLNSEFEIGPVLNETDQLISIFVKSIKTAQSKL